MKPGSGDQHQQDHERSLCEHLAKIRIVRSARKELEICDPDAGDGQREKGEGEEPTPERQPAA